MYHHGLITQIPSVVYAVSLARTKRYATPIGDFSVHHLTPDFFFGFEVSGTFQVKIATPEKALIDTLYLFSARSRLFRALPELDLQRSFNHQAAERTIRKIPSRSKRTIVQRLYNRLLG